MTDRKAGILSEQLAAAEAHAKRLEAAAEAGAELQARQEPLERELRLWRSTLDGVASGSGSSGAGGPLGGPEGVLGLLGELRGQVLALKERGGEKEAEVHQLQGGFFCHHVA